MTEDPPRIVDDPSMPDALRSDLQSAIDHPPAIELPPGPTLSGPSLVGTLLGAGVVALVLGGAIWASLPADTPRTTSPVESAAAAVEPAVPQPATPPEGTAAPEPEETAAPEPAETAAPEPAETAAPEPAETAAPEPEETAASEPAETAVPSTRAPTRQAPTLADEIAHMAELRRSAGSDPRRALAMARAGERQFAAGLFGEERQALIVLSLDRLGRDAAARAAARRFLRAHPASTFRARVEPIASASEGSRRSPHEGR